MRKAKLVECCLFCKHWGSQDGDILNLKKCDKSKEEKNRKNHCDKFMWDTSMKLNLKNYENDDRVKKLIAKYEVK